MKTLFIILTMAVCASTFAAKHSLIICQGHYFLQMTINNKPALFIIDSGSSKSIIDVSKDSVYNFSYIEFGDQQYAGIGGNSQIYMVYNYIIVETQNAFLGVNIGKMLSFFKTDIPIVGILGSDFLFNSKAVLNYGNNTIEF
jgi:hypothetical protein